MKNNSTSETCRSIISFDDECDFENRIWVIGFEQELNLSYVHLNQTKSSFRITLHGGMWDSNSNSNSNRDHDSTVLNFQSSTWVIQRRWIQLNASEVNISHHHLEWLVSGCGIDQNSWLCTTQTNIGVIMKNLLTGRCLFTDEHVEIPGPVLTVTGRILCFVFGLKVTSFELYIAIFLVYLESLC